MLRPSPGGWQHWQHTRLSLCRRRHDDDDLSSNVDSGKADLQSGRSPEAVKRDQKLVARRQN